MQARFQQLRNDLFWEIFDREQGKFIKWMGYDDSYWWNNVAKSEQFQVRGKYKLNPISNEVTVLCSFCAKTKEPVCPLKTPCDESRK